VKKTQELLRRAKSFKVFEVSMNRKPVSDFLLVIFGHFAYLSHPLGLKGNARCSS